MRWLGLPALLLLLTVAAPGIVADEEKTAADYFVRSLPGQPDGPLVKMHAGHIEVDHESNGNLFFWHYQNKHIAQRQRTVLWLNGGPGCSSMDGALMEVGPYRLKDEKTLIHNEGSWHEFANLLFVDQPVGTGFSYVSTDHGLHELDEMADHMMKFLDKFFTLFPEYEADDIYIAGESYAGQYIPYIAEAILKRNKDAAKDRLWNLKGLLIGNGWIDPAPQYNSYLTFAYKHDILKKDSRMAKDLEKILTKCNEGLEAETEDHVENRFCEGVLTTLLKKTQHRNDKGQNVCWNMYDVRLEDSYPYCGMNWPPDLEQMTPYLRRDDVKQALHINADKSAAWVECAGAVTANFTARNSKPSIKLFPDILKEVPILLFSGDQDLICNHIGTEELIHNLEWNGGKGFELSPGNWAPREDWKFEGEPAGIYQTARNLTYVLFYNSSHMVPFDVPRRSRDMLDRFMEIDIASIGGHPADSRIAGEKGPLTSVGNHPNSTAAEQAQKQKLQEARWSAYYKSGELALVFVATAAVIWGIVIYRARRARARLGYKNVRGSEVTLEAGREWDETQLSELTPRNDQRYSVGGASDEESDEESDIVKPVKEKPKSPSNGA
ncbi:pheromone-processing carboxypeptidase KEX1 [Geopyxis carbonaria]|nr:pheromone-processing carboxypeptidase KEX1 [Geopyxis carbonaria]